MPKPRKKASGFMKNKIPRKPAYQIESTFAEPQIEKDISHYLGYITPIGQAPFLLWDGEEAISGADAKFDCAIPIYMQFKVSHGLKSISSIPLSDRKNRSMLEEVRKFRFDNNLDDNPTLYFGLRKKAKNADEFQHNLLLKYAGNPNFHAIYVAPLTLDRNFYENSLMNSATRFLNFPFYYEEYITIHQRQWASHLGMVPFLRNFISIVPHERIDTELHYYSFSQNGTDIAWHSPQYLQEGPSRLSDTLSGILLNAFNNKESWVSLTNLVGTLNKIADVKDFNITGGNESESILRTLQNYGRLLNEQHKIKQVLLLSNMEFITRI
jgi:hypothetical protein